MEIKEINGIMHYEIDLPRVNIKYCSKALYQYDNNIDYVEPTAAKYLKTNFNYNSIRFENKIINFTMSLLTSDYAGSIESIYGVKSVAIDYYNSNIEFKQKIISNFEAYKNKVAKHISFNITEEDFNDIIIFIDKLGPKTAFRFCVNLFLHTGLPDLFVYNDNEYQFCEVKSSGDRLNNNQLKLLKNLKDKYNCKTFVLKINDLEFIDYNMNFNFNDMLDIQRLKYLYSIHAIHSQDIIQLYLQSKPELLNNIQSKYDAKNILLKITEMIDNW